MKKPSSSAIRSALPLSENPERGADPILSCNVCGRPGDSLAVWREADERDIPPDGPEHLVFIAKDHPACLKKMDAHPRLYAEVTGLPGTFPCLCGDCPLRRGFECSHPKLSKNGGPGLLVQISDPMRNIIACSRGGRVTAPKHAVSCEGKPGMGKPQGLP